MPRLDFEFSQDELFQELSSGIGELFDNETNRPLHEAVMEEVGKGRSGAYFVPMVNFAVSVAVNACSQESVRTRLPTEVDSRACIASAVAIRVAHAAAEDGIFLQAYQNSPVLRPALTKNSFQQLFERSDFPPNIASQCNNPILETSQVAGGAKHILDNNKLFEDTSSIVAGSRGLLLISRIRRGDKPTVDARLGQPYVRLKHLQINNVCESSLATVSFKPKTIAYLHAFMDKDSGCEASRVNPNDGEQTTMLRRGWRDIVRYLLDEKATVDPTLTMNKVPRQLFLRTLKIPTVFN